MCIYLATVKSKGKRVAVGRVSLPDSCQATADRVFEHYGIVGDVAPSRHVITLKMFAGYAADFRDLGSIDEAEQNQIMCIYYARRYAVMFAHNPEVLARILADPDYSHVRNGYEALGWPVE